MCLQGEYRVTPGSLQFLHTEQHVYLKSRILLATFYLKIVICWPVTPDLNPDSKNDS